MVNGGQLNPGYNVTSKFFFMKLPKQEGGRCADRVFPIYILNLSPPKFYCLQEVKVSNIKLHIF